MIRFTNINQDEPYKLFKSKYDEAFCKKQKNIEAVSISSYSKKTNEVDSRFVNLKIIDGKDFIFFSNYNSKKSKQFLSNDNIAALFFWNSINTQIRIKAKINLLDKLASDIYFETRNKEKNALAISSKQSETISSFSKVKENYLNALKESDLKKRPEYWGGFTFVPYEFEFWVGHEYRLNQRTLYKLKNDVWKKTFLQP